jgi:peptidoglycan/LPS O-acetylase OafA/YrhL
MAATRTREPEPASGASLRIGALDGLRGIAAAIVVLTHSLSVLQITAQALHAVMRSPLAPLVNGAGAVQTFFVLSGFVLSASLSRPRGRLPTTQFLVRRVFRILPPYWFGLLFAWSASFFYVALPVGQGFTPWVEWQAAVHLPWRELLPSFAWPGMAGGQFPVGWTLRVEMFFSMAMPLLFALATRVHWLLLVIAAVVAQELPDTAGFGLSYAIDFALGIAVFQERARIRRFFDGRSRTVVALALIASLTLFAAPLLFFPLRPMQGLFVPAYLRLGILEMGLGSAGLVACAIGSEAVGRALSRKACLFMGRVSYSFYLVHFPILLLVLRCVGQPPGWLDAALIPPTVFVASLTLASVAHRFVERPAIRAGSIVCRRIGGR